MSHLKRFPLLLVLALLLAALLAGCGTPRWLDTLRPAWMTRSGAAAAGSTAAGGPAAAPPPAVERAVAALGGADGMRRLRSLTVRGTAKYWEPEQSLRAGGDARFAADASFDMTFDFADGRTRIDWDKRFAYPVPRTYSYVELVTSEAGYVAGVDSSNRNLQSLNARSPAHTMSGLRLAAAQREMARLSPQLLLDMHDHPGRVTPMPDQTVGGAAYHAVAYGHAGVQFIVLFDPKSGLPARVRTQDYDNIWGDVDYDLVLSAWQSYAGLRVPTHLRYELGGRLVAEVHWSQLAINPKINPPGMTVPAAMRATAARPAAGSIPYQWIIRRQFIGTYLDSDNPGYDTLAVKSLRLHELAPGVQHVVGGTHNALVVEMRDYLIVFDAPVSDAQSSWTLRAAQARYGPKPVRYLVLTHHHMDHAGGLRAYLAQGAALVVGKGTMAHYRRVLAAPAHRNPDLAAYDFSRTNIIEVEDRYVMSDGHRQVSAHLAANPHAEGMLIGYVADARIGFVADLWSPSAAPLPRPLTPPLLALVRATRQAGISPLRYAGGHGGSGEYAQLAGLVAQK